MILADTESAMQGEQPTVRMQTQRWVPSEADPSGEADFQEFFRDAQAKLHRSLSGGLRPEDVADAVNEAMLYAWENRDRVLAMEEPIGYLYRVAQSKARRRKQGFLAWPQVDLIPDIEPGLVSALAKLPTKAATAIWLVKACGFSQVEAANAMDVSPSTVSTHVERGMRKLRSELGVNS